MKVLRKSMVRLRRLAAKLFTRRNIRRRLLPALAIITLLQLIYPPNRALLGQRVGDQAAWASTADQLREELPSRQATTKLTLKSEAKTQTLTWQELGILIDAEATAAKATDYPLQWRLVPLSGLYKVAFDNTELELNYDQARLTKFANQLAIADQRASQNAGLSVKDDKVLRQPEVVGYHYDAPAVIKQIKSAQPEPGETVKLQPRRLQPGYTLKDVESTAKKTESLMASKLEVEIEKDKQKVSAEEIGRWLKFEEQNNQLAVIVNKEKIKAYLAARGQKLYKAPSKTVIVIRDGREVQRETGAKGQEINTDFGVDKLTEALAKATTTKAASATVRVPIKQLQPEVVYQKTYTRSSAGLNALLNELVSKEPNMAITVRALDKSAISGAAKGDKRYDPASTYKLPMAYEVLKRIENGSLGWGDNVNGRNVDRCFSDMIVISDNPCANAFGNRFGWSTVTSSAHAIGMSNTHLASRSNFVSTTDDQATFLTKLQNGQLVNNANRDRLLDLMKRQKYRAGVPAGSKGSAVANKVGFIGGLLHDSAIVYSPKGTYVIAVYSSGGNWSDIANAGREVYDLMNQ